MVDLTLLLETLAAVLADCPGIAELAAPEAYLDVTAEKNSLTRAVYTQANGTLLVAWQSSTLNEGDAIQGWQHQIDVYARADRRESALGLLNAVIDGVPATDGGGLRWRYICILDAVDPVQIQEIARLTDEEGIDYYVIRCLFREKGD